jgi:hypothetical protein
MMSNRYLTLTLLALFTLTTACSKPDNGPAEVPASAEAQKLALTADPGAALAVAKVKADGPKDEVTVEGRLYKITKGYAAMRIMDLTMDYCGEINKEENCPTPWDYCCNTKGDIAAGSLLVEARNADGKPLKTPALPNLRLLDKVKVTGKLIKDDHGNLVLLASGMFRSDRPTVPDFVKWPE